MSCSIQVIISWKRTANCSSLMFSLCSVKCGKRDAWLKFRITSTMKQSHRIDLVTADPTGIRFIIPISLSLSFSPCKASINLTNSQLSSVLNSLSSALIKQYCSKDQARAPWRNLSWSETAVFVAVSIAVIALYQMSYSLVYFSFSIRLACFIYSFSCSLASLALSFYRLTYFFSSSRC